MYIVSNSETKLLKMKTTEEKKMNTLKKHDQIGDILNDFLFDPRNEVNPEDNVLENISICAEHDEGFAERFFDHSQPVDGNCKNVLITYFEKHITADTKVKDF